MFKQNRFLSAHGADPSMLRSMLQKGIRLGHMQAAVSSAAELIASGYANGVIERLISVAHEDIGYENVRLINSLEALHERHKKNKVPMIEILRYVQECVRSQHCHAAAWLNMLASRWPLDLEPVASMDERIQQLKTKFVQALDERDLKMAITTGSALDLLSRVVTDKKTAAPYADLVKLPKREYVDAHKLTTKTSNIKKTVLIEIYNELYSRVEDRAQTFVKNCCKDGSRLALINAILIVVRHVIHEVFVNINQNDNEELMALKTLVHYMEAEPTRENMIKARNHLPPAMDWVDKHCSFAKRVNRDYVQRELEKNQIVLTSEELDRTHPPYETIDKSKFTHMHFINTYTVMENPSEFDAVFRDEGKAAYTSEEPVRARDFFKRRIDEIVRLNRKRKFDEID